MLWLAIKPTDRLGGRRAERMFGRARRFRRAGRSVCLGLNVFRRLSDRAPGCAIRPSRCARRRHASPPPPTPNIPICDCVVVNGYSVGFQPCPEHAQSGRKVRSAFSTANVNAGFAVLHCPPGVTWANCLNVECEIDPHNPAVAKCQCLTVKTGESVTFGGATPLPVHRLYGRRRRRKPMVDFPRTCPASK